MALATRPEPPAPPIRVLVVDDLAPLRRLLTRQLTRVGHLVVGEAATVAEALVRAATVMPDVVVLDFHLPDGRGTDVAGRLGHPAPAGRRPGIVFCTSDRAGVHAALGVGPGAAVAGDPEGTACGGAVVLEKPTAADALDAAVREAAARAGRPGSVRPA